MKILREIETMLTVFQMIDLWKAGCRCPARSAGLSETRVELEQGAQALVTSILVLPCCVLHDPDHANADGLWGGGEVGGVMAAEVGDVQVILPPFGPAVLAATPDERPSESMLARLVRMARQYRR